MIRVRSSNLLFAAAAASFAAAAVHGIAGAQAAPPPPPQFAIPPYKNLQILSKDITRDQLMTNMKFFAQSLGVRCSHCHVGEEGKPLSTFDFASDDKKEKKTARAMLKMVHRINSEEFGVKQAKDVKVTCYTCHRGAKKPEPVIPPAPPPPAPSAG